MKQNPAIFPCGSGLAIRFYRGQKNLLWIQDLTGRKMKSEFVSRPTVIFSSLEEAEAEIHKEVLPYLLKEKGENPEDIWGWP